MKKILLLNSGGLDSAMLAKLLTRDKDLEVHSLFVDTNTLVKEETLAAAAMTADMYCKSHHVISIDYGRGSNYWENTWRKPVEGMEPGEVIMLGDKEGFSIDRYSEKTYTQFKAVPNAAMLHLSLGVAYAKVIGASEVYTGHRISLTEDYIAEYNKLADKSLLRLSHPEVVSPLSIYATYSDSIRAAFEIDVWSDEWKLLREEFVHTHSCRLPDPCGFCDKCTERTVIGL